VHAKRIGRCKFIALSKRDKTSMQSYLEPAAMGRWVLE
jgi:hypothetical protein